VGTCGQGLQETAAVAALADAAARARGTAQHVVVVERIHGDEQAFGRDHQPATAGERAQTLAILSAARQQTLALIRLPRCGVGLGRSPAGAPAVGIVAHASPDGLARGRHTESRYYLPRLGLAGRPREADLLGELQRSAAHVQAAVRSVAPALLRRSDGEVWTTTKLLRRLAWHERGEVVVMRRLAERARQHLPGA
jgi:hypothetical protein